MDIYRCYCPNQEMPPPGPLGHCFGLLKTRHRTPRPSQILWHVARPRYEITFYVIKFIIIYLLQNMFFLHMRCRQELRSRIATQYLESRNSSKIDKTHIIPLGEKAISLVSHTHVAHIIPREKKAYHQMIGYLTCRGEFSICAN